MDEWRDKEMVVLTHSGTLLSIWKMEILPFVTTWMILVDIMLKEKARHRSIILNYLHQQSKIVKFMEAGS